MVSTWYGWALVAVLLLGAGCQRSATPANGAGGSGGTNGTAPPTNAPSSTALAQPKLPVIKLWIGSQEITAEIARTAHQRQMGMMYRESLGENEGMLFVFPRPHRTAFFMKNTAVPLTCAYINAEGIIVELHDLKPFDEAPVEAISDQIQYVLETPRDWFKKNRIGTGMLVRTPIGSLRETFSR